MQNNVPEFSVSLRNKNSYQQALLANDFRETGIKETCIFQNIAQFHVTENCVFDIIHDMYIRRSLNLRCM